MLAETLLQKLKLYVASNYQPAPRRQAPAAPQSVLNRPARQGRPTDQQEDDFDLDEIWERLYGTPPAPAQKKQPLTLEQEAEDKKRLLPYTSVRSQPASAPLRKEEAEDNEELLIPDYLRKEPRDQAAPADLESYVRAHHSEETFSSYLLQLIDARGLTDAAVYKAAGIDRRHFAKIRGKRTYQPKKSTALALALALRLPFAEAEHLLGLSGYTFSQSDLADVILRFCLEQGIYDLLEVNEALVYFEQKPLGVLR